MPDVTLNKDEWEAAMKFVLDSEDAQEAPEADPKPVVVRRRAGTKKIKVVPTKAALVLEIPAGGGFVPRVGTPQPTSNKTMDEIPNNHPAGTKTPVTPADPQKYDTDNAPGITDEIPADGGFQSKVGKPQPTSNKVSSEIPNNHPAGDAKPRTPADWAAAGINYGEDTSAGWSTGRALPPEGRTVWGQPVPSGAPASYYSNGPADGPTKTDTLNRAPRSSLARLTADEDLDHDAPDNLSLPDGSFFVATLDDLKAAVDKVKNADQTNPDKSKPWFTDIKSHLARRAEALNAPNHIVPADWQVMMALHAEAEIARSFDTDERKKLAKSGAALPDGSYPIVDMSDLRNAMRAFGRAKEADRGRVKAHILKRAKALHASPALLKRISALGDNG